MSIRLLALLTAAALCIAGCSKKNEAEEAREAVRLQRLAACGVRRAACGYTNLTEIEPSGP